MVIGVLEAPRGFIAEAAEVRSLTSAESLAPAQRPAFLRMACAITRRQLQQLVQHSRSALEEGTRNVDA